jgi:hypothetical protein
MLIERAKRLHPGRERTDVGSALLNIGGVLTDIGRVLTNIRRVLKDIHRVLRDRLPKVADGRFEDRVTLAAFAIDAIDPLLEGGARGFDRFDRGAVLRPYVLEDDPVAPHLPENVVQSWKRSRRSATAQDPPQWSWRSVAH